VLIVVVFVILGGGTTFYVEGDRRYAYAGGWVGLFLLILVVLLLTGNLRLR
jgi:hypothetical protein